MSLKPPIVRGTTSGVLNSVQNTLAQKAPPIRGNKNKQKLQSQLSGGVNPRQQKDTPGGEIGQVVNQRQQQIDKSVVSKSKFINEMISSMQQAQVPTQQLFPNTVVNDAR